MTTTSPTRLPARSPIGIDVGRHSIKAVQLRGGRDGWRLRRKLLLPRAADGASCLEHTLHPQEVQRLCQVLERNGFVGNAAVLAVPDSDLLTSILDLPPRAPGVPLDAIARMEFARVHKCEPLALQLSCWDLPEAARASKGTAVMAVGYTHAKADAYLDVLEGAGLDVVAMDTAASAIARACLPLQSADATTAVLDMGAGAARLVLVQAGVVTYERTVADCGLAHLATLLGDRLDLDREQVQFVLEDAGLGEPGERRGAEALGAARLTIVAQLAPLLADLQMTFAYAEQRYPASPVNQLLLAGGGALMPGVAAHMAQGLGLVVRCVGCGEVVHCDTGADDHATPLLLKAIGLAQFPDI